MSHLDKLKNAKSLSDLAGLLRLAPRGLSYNLYKLGESQKYTSFEIKKRNGGQRTIEAPCDKVKLMQTRLADFLYKCIDELKDEHRYYLFHSHGFQKQRHIISNAELHRRRRYVFNVDLEDFFGTINFGRVRGFFIADERFKTDPKIATIIAQIACYKNALPQGSPCSPIISNLIGNILDRRLSSLARSVKCTYTRYADDLTFSTNMKSFPDQIAIKTSQEKWCIGMDLLSVINRSGFNVNDRKTRMSLRCSRQVVTGLVVNNKVNINQDYYRSVRAMCYELFKKGQYYLPQFNKSDLSEDKQYVTGLDPLEGMLSFIYFVKMRRDRRDIDKKNKNWKRKGKDKERGEFFLSAPDEGIGKLYKKFLFYKYFITPSAPLIMTEGETDIIYLKHAIHELHKKFPKLANFNNKDKKIERCIKFVKRSGMAINTLGFAGGTSGQKAFIELYTTNMASFKHKQIKFPVIILCDNDEGAKSIFSVANKKFDCSISLSSDNPFYHLVDNLYLIKVPIKIKEGYIEKLFPPKVLKIKIDGKKLEPLDGSKDKNIDSSKDKNTYSKKIFATRVIAKNRKIVDFSGFEELLKRIEDCIKDCEAKYIASK